MFFNSLIIVCNYYGLNYCTMKILYENSTMSLLINKFNKHIIILEEVPYRK